MNKTRILLIVLSLIVILCFIGIGSVSEKAVKDKTAGNLMGVFGLIMAIATIANAIISYRYAWKAGLQPFLWALGALLIPFIVPLILALYREKSPEPLITPVDSDAPPFAAGEEKPDIIIREGMGKSSSWSFEDIRLFCLIMPYGFKWRLITTTEETSFFFPDLMPSEDSEAFFQLLDKTVSAGNKNELSGIKACIIDYNNKGSVYELKKLKNAKELLSGLYQYREARKNKLDKWLESSPSVTLTGGMGSSATLDREGFHLKKISVPWPEAARVTSETTYGLSAIFVLPEERSGGLFDLKRAKYALARVPAKKKELYTAEIFFWKTLFGGD